jgi:hypothetical protein
MHGSYHAQIRYKTSSLVLAISQYLWVKLTWKHLKDRPILKELRKSQSKSYSIMVTNTQAWKEDENRTIKKKKQNHHMSHINKQ